MKVPNTLNFLRFLFEFLICTLGFDKKSVEIFMKLKCSTFHMVGVKSTHRKKDFNFVELAENSAQDF